MKRVGKLPSPDEVQQKAVNKIDEEREALRRRMMMWDGGKRSRITLYDLSHKEQLIMELEGLGWKGYQGIAIEPDNWTLWLGSNLPTPAELYEALEQEHAAAIQRELDRLQSQILPMLLRTPQQRGLYTCSGLHPFVVQYLMDSLRESGWWVEFAPTNLSVEKQLLICPRNQT